MEVIDYRNLPSEQKIGLPLSLVNPNIKTNISFELAPVIRLTTYCYYCGDVLITEKTTRDHIIPISKNGRNTKANKVLCCMACNKLKDNLSLEAFSDLVTNTPTTKRGSKKKRYIISQIKKLIGYRDAHIKDMIGDKKVKRTKSF